MKFAVPDTTGAATRDLVSMFAVHVLSSQLLNLSLRYVFNAKPS